MPRLSDAQYGEMRRLLNAGQSCEKVAKAVGCAPSVVGRWGLKWGIGRRKKKQPTKTAGASHQGARKKVVIRKCSEHGPVEQPCRACATIRWMAARGKKP